MSPTEAVRSTGLGGSADRGTRTEAAVGQLIVCEVGPRDGLQNEARVLTVAERVELIDRLSECGFPRIEVGSFVSPRRVPQMAEPEAVFAAIQRRPGTEYVGLALSTTGARRAIASGVDRLNFAFVVTETFNQRNQGRTVAESLAELAEVVQIAADAHVPVTAILGASFGCPFEGPVQPQHVAQLAARAQSCGVSELAVADTIGVAVPAQVADVVGRLRTLIPTDMVLGCHFHNTRNTGFANAVAAVTAGANELDASVGGAGGCPFAPKATGNIATEDLLYLLDGSGIPTGVDVNGVIAAAEWLEGRLGHKLPGMVKDAGVNWYGAAA